MAVVDAVADKLKRNAPSVTAGELHSGITVPEQAPCLIAVVTTVIVVVTAVMVLDTSPIGAGEGCRVAGVKR